jgi:hypothetical protein
MPICERYLPKDFCKKCRRVAAACLCVTAIGAHDVPHTDPEPVHMPMTRTVVVAVSSTAATTIRPSGIGWRVVGRPPG